MVDPKTNQRRGKGEGRIPNPRSKSLFGEEKSRPKSEEGKGDNLGELESNKRRVGTLTLTLFSHSDELEKKRKKNRGWNRTLTLDPDSIRMNSKGKNRIS